MSGQRKNLPEGDDGRTIAPMNVDGMPWYDPRREKTPDGMPERESLMEPMTFRQRLSAYGGILAAVGLVTVIFGVVYFLAIFLMDAAWA